MAESTTGAPLPADGDALFTAVYDELRRVAHRQLRRLDAGATLCTTELVHETFLKLSHGRSDWESRGHFFGAASRAMRQILVDFARRRRATKRGGDVKLVTLDEATGNLDVELDRILDLDAALVELDASSPRLRQVVELRFFAGLGEHEVAELLGVTTRTVERDWLKARLFLLRALGH